jgi:hypothetical protein
MVASCEFAQRLHIGVVERGRPGAIREPAAPCRHHGAVRTQGTVRATKWRADTFEKHAVVERAREWIAANDRL